MSVHQTAQMVFVHFNGRFGYHLFGLHVRRVLPGFPIPSQYTVHDVLEDEANRSINLAMTNGGNPINLQCLEQHIKDLKIFGSVSVGVYGIAEVKAS